MPMQSLSQLRSVTGRAAPFDLEAYTRLQVPQVYQRRQAEIENQRLALLRDEQDASERQARGDLAAANQAILVQAGGTAVQGGLLTETAFPGTLAKLKGIVGLGGSPAAPSGAAAASGLTGATAASSAAASTVPATLAAAETVGEFATAGTVGSTVGPLASLAPYALPAAGGFVAGKIGGAIAPHLLPLGGRTGERVERDIGGTAAGAGAGALIGSAVLPGPGTAVGAVIGGLAGLLGAESVIATAVNGVDHPHTQLALRFKRQRVGSITYAGYRRLGDPIAIYIHAHPWAKPVVKHLLIVPMVQAMQAELAEQPWYHRALSRSVLKLCLQLCRHIGERRVYAARIVG